MRQLPPDSGPPAARARAHGSNPFRKVREGKALSKTRFPCLGDAKALRTPR